MPDTTDGPGESVAAELGEAAAGTPRLRAVKSAVATESTAAAAAEAREATQSVTEAVAEARPDSVATMAAERARREARAGD